MDILDIWKFELRQGNSTDPREGACLLDAVSWLEYGCLGDHPECVCPVIAVFGRSINDVMSDAGRQRLKIFIPRLVGTVDPDAEKERAEYLAWQAIRVFAPLALDAAGFGDEARKLREFDGKLKDAARVCYDAARASAPAADAADDAAACASARASNAAAYAADAADAADASYAAAEAAAYAAVAARAACAALASDAATEDAMIATLDGVLRIGRQAEPVLPARHAAANESFELARGGVA